MPAPAIRPIALALALGAAQAGPSAFLRGGDMSFLDQYESLGLAFRDGGQERDAFRIVRDHGFDCVRLRLWHSPDTPGYCDLDRTIRQAKRVRALGMDVLLDFHFSDTWADPDHQAMPKAWAGLPAAAVLDSVQAYARATMARFRAEGAMPAWVQLGNEIDNGILWPLGDVRGADTASPRWDTLALLLRRAAQGLREGSGNDTVSILLHLAPPLGSDPASAARQLAKRGVPFDAIGLSAYRFSYGDLGETRRRLEALAAAFGKPVAVAETGYPWSLGNYDGRGNYFTGAGQLEPGFPATPAGQKAYLDSLFRLVRAVPGGLGLGVLYWPTEYVAGRPEGSTSDNMALFDSARAALPAMDAFRAPTTGLPAAVRAPRALPSPPGARRADGREEKGRAAIPRFAPGPSAR